MPDPSTAPDHAGVVVFPPLLFAGCLASGLMLHWFWPIATGIPWVPRVVVAGLALVIAAALGLGGERALHGAGTNVRPDRPTTAVVSDGVYRFTRNPLYLALLHVYAAVALFTDALWPFALWVVMLPVLTRGIVEREERYLERKFGQPYLDYKSRVRRWI